MKWGRARNAKAQIILRGGWAKPAIFQQRRQPDAEAGAVEPAWRLFICRRSVHKLIEQQRN
jgi:hypothetical protein